MENLDLKSIGAQAAALWRGMKTLQRAAVALVILAVLGGVLYLSLGETEPEHGVLFTSLSPEDAAAIVDALQAEKVPHRIEANGSRITVPRDRVEETRLSVTSKGLPRGGGVGFELFDQQSFATTTFVEEMNYRRALAGELGRTIGSLDPIERARVHIAMSERSLYKKDEVSPAVSVAVRLRPGRSLSKAQLDGIVHLVASSVAKLTPDRVTVVDESGAVLWTGGQNDSAAERQHEIERTLTDRIRALMDRVVGPGQSVVVVTATMDASQSERTEELFDKNNTVLRSQTRTEQLKYGSQVGGIVGVQANLPETAVPPATKTDRPKDSRLTETQNFEVNRITNRIVKEPLQLRRLHVAILVNAPSSARTSSTSGIAIGSDVRTEIEIGRNLERVAALVREAAGLDLERGDRLEIHTLPFAAEPIAEVAPTSTATAQVAPIPEPWYPIAAGAACALLIAVIAGAVAIRRSRRRKLESEADEEAPAVAAEPEPERPPIHELVRDAVRKDADRAAQILSTWLRESEETP
jgi:flagellar M-ring protein FliF